MTDPDVVTVLEAADQDVEDFAVCREGTCGGACRFCQPAGDPTL